MAQTYQTRHLTARDHQLIDALEGDPRYRKVAAMLRPPAKATKAEPAKAAKAPEPAAAPAAKAPEPAKGTTTTPTPDKAASGHAVGAMGTPKPTPKDR